MTYCVAMRLSAGMIFVSDSRTNAGVDHISSFRKLHVFQVDDERTLVQSAGNLATTQSVMSLLRRNCNDSEQPNLLNGRSLYDIALLVGATLREVIARDGEEFGGTLLLAGRFAAKSRGCSRSIRRATLLKPASTRRTSRLVRANTVSQLLTACCAMRPRSAGRCSVR